MRKNLFGKLLLGTVLSLGIAAAKPVVPLTDDGIVQRTGHEIRMYPHYTIWDNITYRVQNGEVELNGEVSQPYKKEDLNRIVGRIPGVVSVTNNLKVLPPKDSDCPRDLPRSGAFPLFSRASSFDPHHRG
jgi:hypothetical protein